MEPGTWRFLFVIPPLITVAAAAAMLFAVKEDPAAAGYPSCVKDEIDNSAGTKVPLKESFPTIFTHPLVRFYAAAYACTGAACHSSDQLSVMFFTEQLGIDLKAKPLSVLVTMNLMTAAVMLTGLIQPGAFGVFLGGMFLVMTSLTVNSTPPSASSSPASSLPNSVGSAGIPS